ncbi:MAG: MarR family winged helix-turn-helix transcriptional regulator [Acidimicrobiales bacterium]
MDSIDGELPPPPSPRRPPLRRPQPDIVDHVLERWRRERPDIDASGKAVTGRVVRLNGLFHRAFQVDFALEEIDEGGFAVLAALRRAGQPFELTPTELNRELLISSGGLTHLVDRLVRRGLVRRRPDDGDRRCVRVILTPAGRKVADRAMVAHAATERRLVSGLTSEERDQLADLLRRLVLSVDGPLPS